MLQHLLDLDVEAGIFLDLWKFWKLFESNDSELLCQVRDPSYPIIYHEVPPKFGNDIFFPVGPRLSKLESSASITVDIPNECGGGEWWGIVVFIAFEPMVSSSFSTFKIDLCWSFEAPHPEAGPSLYLSSHQAEAHYNRCLVTMIMNDNYIYIQLHHRKYHNICESKSFSKHRKPDFSENSRVRLDVQGGLQKIKQCGYHLLCKEDFRSEALLKSHDTPVDKPNSDMEFRGEDATASNGEGDQIRSIAGRLQAEELPLSVRYLKVPSLFVFLCFVNVVILRVAVVILLLPPFQFVAVLAGIYVLRHPRFRHKLPSVPLLKLCVQIPEVPVPGLFVFLCFVIAVIFHVAAVIFHLSPFKVGDLLLAGIFVFRHPRFPHKLPSVLLNFFRRLPACFESSA